MFFQSVLGVMLSTVDRGGGDDRIEKPDRVII
jgi:hypothetical protein